jgi:hypothetical protein
MHSVTDDAFTAEVLELAELHRDIVGSAAARQSGSGSRRTST